MGQVRQALEDLKARADSGEQVTSADLDNVIALADAEDAPVAFNDEAPAEEAPGGVASSEPIAETPVENPNPTP